MAVERLEEEENHERAEEFAAVSVSRIVRTICQVMVGTVGTLLVFGFFALILYALGIFPILIDFVALVTGIFVLPWEVRSSIYLHDILVVHLFRQHELCVYDINIDTRTGLSLFLRYMEALLSIIASFALGVAASAGLGATVAWWRGSDDMAELAGDSAVLGTIVFSVIEALLMMGLLARFFCRRGPSAHQDALLPTLESRTPDREAVVVGSYGATDIGDQITEGQIGPPEDDDEPEAGPQDESNFESDFPSGSESIFEIAYEDSADKQNDCESGPAFRR